MIGFIIFAALLSIPTIIDVHHAGIAAQSMPLTNETDKEKVISQVKSCIKRKGYNFSDQDIRTKFSHINKYNPMATNTEENIERIAKVIILILKDKNVYEAK